MVHVYCPGKVVVSLALTGKCRTTGACFALRVVCRSTLLRHENVPARVHNLMTPTSTTTTTTMHVVQA